MTSRADRSCTEYARRELAQESGSKQLGESDLAAIDEYERHMTEETIPEIVRAVERRRAIAQESRSRQMKSQDAAPTSNEIWEAVATLLRAEKEGMLTDGDRERLKDLLGPQRAPSCPVCRGREDGD